MTVPVPAAAPTFVGLAGGPAGLVELPSSLLQVAAGRAVRPVWRNELGGLTVEVDTDPDRCFLKWTPPGTVCLDEEASRLRWAQPWTPVPQVLGVGADDAGSWMLTAALPGENAVSPRWRTEPARAVWALGEGLRALHDALPVADCPYSWSAADRVDDARRRAAAGMLDPRRWHEEHRALGVAGALDVLADTPPPDRLVVCCGDACAPNTLVGADGRWSGHVDLGSLGVADRWADLAVATWSCDWNYGPGWQDLLLASYGVAADPHRTAYYRLLWDVGP